MQPKPTVTVTIRIPLDTAEKLTRLLASQGATAPTFAALCRTLLLSAVDAATAALAGSAEVRGA